MSVCLESSSVSLVAETLPGTALSGQVQRRLRESSYQPIRRVQVEQHGHGAMTLYGKVPSFYQKQIAQSIAGKVKGVELVVNRIDVVDSAELHRNKR